MTRQALVLVRLEEGRDEHVEEALRMAVGLTLGVSRVRVVLLPPCAVDSGVPVTLTPRAVRHLDALSEIRVPVLALPGCGALPHPVATCSRQTLDHLLIESYSTLVW